MALGSGVHVGDDVMAAEEVARAQHLREQQHTQHQANVELAAAQRLEAVLEPAGALHLPLSRVAGGDALDLDGEEGLPGSAAGRSFAWRSREERVCLGRARTRRGAERWPLCVRVVERGAGGDSNVLSNAAFAATARSTDHLYTPAWRLIEADDLEKRAASLVKFQRSSWKIIYAARLRKCLQRIQARQPSALLVSIGPRSDSLGASFPRKVRQSLTGVSVPCGHARAPGRRACWPSSGGTSSGSPRRAQTQCCSSARPTGQAPRRPSTSGERTFEPTIPLAAPAGPSRRASATHLTREDWTRPRARRPDNVRTRPLPLYRDINFTFHGPLAISHYTDFDELGPQQPR